jgi:hypothetical protein
VTEASSQTNGFKDQLMTKAKAYSSDMQNDLTGGMICDFTRMNKLIIALAGLYLTDGCYELITSLYIRMNRLNTGSFF